MKKRTTKKKTVGEKIIRSLKQFNRKLKRSEKIECTTLQKFNAWGVFDGNNLTDIAIMQSTAQDIAFDYETVEPVTVIRTVKSRARKAGKKRRSEPRGC